MDKEFPKPETQLNVLRRYLHVLSLLQNKDDKTLWNASTLADLLSREESGEPLTNKTIRDYIRKNLEEDLGISIKKKKGGRRTELVDIISPDLLKRIASIYSSFVISDTTKDIVLERLIIKHPTDCLWMLSRIHFAIVEKKKIRFDYMPNTERKVKKYLVHPYHLVFRNNNLYLIAKNEANDILSLFIMNKIDKLAVANDSYKEIIPKLNDIFADTLGSFIGKRYDIRIRFTRKVLPMIDQVISILEPKIIEIQKEEIFEASFSTTDDLYICKQLFLYGKEVEILEPKEMRDIMIRMLNESLGVYNKM